jgi:uncharacterized membrane protein
MTRRGKLTGAVAAAIAAATLAAPLAAADHHLVSVREVFPGSTGTGGIPNAEYVELQMFSSGQNLFAGKGATVTLHNGAGAVTRTVALGADVANGASQSRVLVASASAESTFGVEADFEFADGDFVNASAGAACFNSFLRVDCVSWGGFAGSLPSATGGNAAPGGIPDQADALPGPRALLRSEARSGCAGTLEGSDDTGSPADWLLATPDPDPNSLGPEGTACPNTTITGRPPNRTTRRRATFSFSSSRSPATFACRLDGGPFTACSSPFRTPRLAVGRHTFAVRAIAGGLPDPTPATDAWRVRRRG